MTSQTRNIDGRGERGDVQPRKLPNALLIYLRNISRHQLPGVGSVGYRNRAKSYSQECRRAIRTATLLTLLENLSLFVSRPSCT